MSSIDAVVFDMDGVLVNSEPLWHAAEIEVFGLLGLKLTSADCLQTTGVRVDGVVSHWRNLQPAAFAGVEDQTVVALIVEAVVARVTASATAMEAAVEAIDDVAQRGLKIGLASSSPQVIIDAVLKKLGVRERFSVVCSAEHLPRGKPDPAVYLDACAALGVKPTRAIAVEDSSSGIIAGKNASMMVVAVPDPAAERPTAVDFADFVIGSLKELPALLDWLQR